MLTHSCARSMSSSRRPSRSSEMNAICPTKSSALSSRAVNFAVASCTCEMNAAYVSAASSGKCSRHLLAFSVGEQRVLELLALDAHRPDVALHVKIRDARLLVEKRDGAPAEHVQTHLPGAVVLHHLLQRDILVLRHHLAELLEVLTVLRGGVEPERQRFFHRSHEFSVLFIVDEVDKIRRSGRRRVRRGRVRHLRHQNFIVRKPSKGREGRQELSDGLFDLRLERLHGGRERQRLIAEHELNLKRRKHRGTSDRTR